MKRIKLIQDDVNLRLLELNSLIEKYGIDNVRVEPQTDGTYIAIIDIKEIHPDTGLPVLYD